MVVMDTIHTQLINCYTCISDQPRGRGRAPGTLEHLQRFPSQMLVEAPGVQPLSWNKYPRPPPEAKMGQCHVPTKIEIFSKGFGVFY